MFTGYFACEKILEPSCNICSVCYMACSFQQSSLNLNSKAKPNAWKILYDHYLIVILCYKFHEYISCRKMLDFFFPPKPKDGAHQVLSLSHAQHPAVKTVSSSASVFCCLHHKVVIQTSVHFSCTLPSLQQSPELQKRFRSFQVKPAAFSRNIL